MTKTYRIACIPGDGIGAEVIAAGLQVLEVLASRERAIYIWGRQLIHRRQLLK